MGSDPVSFMENLLLYYYGNKSLLDNRKMDLQKARIFSILFCFIDDLRAISVT